MGYFNNYQEAAIQAGYVDHEGDYEVMILGTKDGTTGDGTQYKQVQCKVNAPGEPPISIFLTDGKNFNGNFTAFCDTFGLPRGNTDFASWRGKRGVIHIMLTKKDGFTNMVPRWIIDEHGYVVGRGKPVEPQQNYQAPVASVQKAGPNGREHEMYGQTTQQQEDDWGNDIPF